MKRTRVVGVDSAVYDPSKDLERINAKLYELCYIAGVDPESNELTIDQLVNALRSSFYYSSPKSGAYPLAAIEFLRTENFHLVIQARKYWWYRQLAIGAQNRG